MALRRTDTIPKLDQVDYLFETLGCVREQIGFDAIRRELIGLRPEPVDDLKRHSTLFWSNARDSLRELMRLGLVKPVALPSRRAQLDAHRARKFTLTEHGEEFLALDERDSFEFRRRFAQAMLIAHPYLRELQRLSLSQELFFPRIQRSELPGDVESWRHAPPEPLEQVASWVADSVQSVIRVSVPTARVEASMRPYLTAAWKRLHHDEKAHMFTKAIVKTFNDVIVRVLLQVYGLRLDYVTFRSAVALLSDLSVIWHTRSLTNRRGWTIWATSVATVPLTTPSRSAAELALNGPTWLTPRVVDEEVIKDLLIETFFSLPDRKGGFALIHVLRAEVCHRFRIHGRDFDAVLRKLHAQTLSDPTYSINLDRGGGDEIPRSEEPFRLGDDRKFYLITLLKRD
jgi:hypothetical protein